jgi:hypothetical protein
MEIFKQRFLGLVIASNQKGIKSGPLLRRQPACFNIEPMI